MLNNCLFFALRKFVKDDGYFIVRRSRHGWWWHFLWSSNLDHFEEFQPLVTTDGLTSPPWLFNGKVVTHDIHAFTEANDH